MSSNLLKSAQLGMPYGTAMHRLRKIVLFSLLERYEENYCYRCGLLILVDELSIEHKLPWQSTDPTLFWDINNIAFSHLRCNREAAVMPSPPEHIWRANINQRKVGEEGTAWCRGHKDFLPIHLFSSNSFNWNHLQGECKECRRARRIERAARKIGADGPTRTGMTNLEGSQPTIG